MQKNSNKITGITFFDKMVFLFLLFIVIPGTVIYFYAHIENHWTWEDKIYAAVKSDPAIEKVGVYVHDLVSNTDFGYGQDQKFNPGSLYKVPLMMAYFKMETEDPTIDSQDFMRVTPEDRNAGQFYKPLKSLELNQPKNAWEMLEYMIEYSDNEATDILYAFVGPERMKKIFNDFNLEFSTNIDQQAISPKDFTQFLLAIYQQNFLGPYSSKMATDLLLKTQFDRGITQALIDTRVAHKFGTPKKVNGSYQLHDCGIIYTKHPYILCVMSQGKNLQSLESILKLISEYTNNEINQ